MALTVITDDENIVMGKPENITTPDENGRFGDFGGRYVAETLMPPILELEKAYGEAKADPSFLAELDEFFNHYVGRPSPLYFAERLTAVSYTHLKLPTKA